MKLPFLTIVTVVAGYHFDDFVVGSHFHALIAGWMEQPPALVVVVPQLVTLLPMTRINNRT